MWIRSGNWKDPKSEPHFVCGSKCWDSLSSLRRSYFIWLFSVAFVAFFSIIYVLLATLHVHTWSWSMRKDNKMCTSFSDNSALWGIEKSQGKQEGKNAIAPFCSAQAPTKMTAHNKYVLPQYSEGRFTTRELDQPKGLGIHFQSINCCVPKTTTGTCCFRSCFAPEKATHHLSHKRREEDNIYGHTSSS